MKDETAMVKLMHSQLNYSLTHHGGLYYIKTNPLIFSANQWTGLHMIGATIKS